MQHATKQANGSDIVAVYKQKLKTEWTQTAYCNRGYVLVNNLRAWMHAKEENHERSNVSRLLRAIHSREKTFSRVDSARVAPAVLVFATLLACDGGHLISSFLDANITDALLDDVALSTRYDSIRHRRFHRTDEDVLEKFEQRRWSFCPVQFKLRENKNCTSSNQILPFCKREKIAEGGTADISMVLVKEEMMPEELRIVMDQSLDEFPEFGRCYRLAIKSYGASDRDLWDYEMSAFEILKDQSGMLQCFGSYSIEEPNSDFRREHKLQTFNLILEYGELDLEEYLANRDQVPPTLPAEISAFWTAVFKIAEALRDIHVRPFVTADTKEDLSGWHADVKPANILRVNGEFKLADFGFAKFKNDPSEVPTEYIEGGTQSYGAPECDAAHEGKGGTRKLVSQTIDVWSYGAVLSLAATWLSLGHQGIKQYDKFRGAAIRELKARHKEDPSISIPIADDTFHDGSDVLPDIRYWHDYLRNLTRPYNTFTHHVLALVDDHLFQKNPEDRYTSVQLCEGLTWIEQVAQEELQDRYENQSLLQLNPILETRLVEIDQRARMKVDRVRAGMSVASLSTVESDSDVEGPMAVSTRILSASSKTLHPPKVMQYRKSKKIGKSKRLDDVQLAKTAHRRDLKSELENRSGHGIDRRSIDSPSTIGTLGTQDDLRSGAYQAESGVLNEKRFSRLGSLTGESPYRQMSRHGERSTMTALHSPPRDGRHTLLASPPSYTLPAAHTGIQDDGMLHDHSPERRSHSITLSRESGTQRSSLTGSEASREFSRDKTSPRIGTASRTSSHDFGVVVNVQAPPEQLVELDATPLGRDVSGTSQSLGLIDLDQTHARYSSEKELSPLSPTSLNTVFNTTPMIRPYTDLENIKMNFSLDIFKTRSDLDNAQSGILKKLLTRSSKDEHLSRFITNRDIVFVVDNASTMAGWWHCVRFTVETLAMKLKGIDKDGLDLRFTSGEAHNLRNETRKDVAAKFATRIDRARPPQHEREIKTDMANVLARIFDEYNRDIRHRCMTLLVFTDGKWQGTVNPDQAVVEKITAFTKLPKTAKTMEQRRFSIEFISFGDDIDALRRLQYLDDDLRDAAEDIVDHEPWTGDVHKMILGSFNEEVDAHSSEPPTSPSAQSPDPRPFSVLSGTSTSTRRSRISGFLNRRNTGAS